MPASENSDDTFVAGHSREYDISCDDYWNQWKYSKLVKKCSKAVNCKPEESTVNPVMRNCFFCQLKTVSRDRWYLIKGGVTYIGVIIGGVTCIGVIIGGFLQCYITRSLNGMTFCSILKKLCTKEFVKEKRGSRVFCQHSEGSGDENMDIESFSDCKCLSKWQPSGLCTVLLFQHEKKYSSMAKKILEERGMHSISEQNYGNPNDGVSEESTEKSGVNSDTSDRTLGLALKSSDKREDENLQVEDVILFNTAKDLNNTENKSCGIWEGRVDVTAKTSCQAEIENLRFKRGTSKFLAQNLYSKELDDLTVKDRIISVTAQICFSTESEVEGLIVKKETDECTFQTSDEAEDKDLRVNSETLKITTKTHTSAGMEVEYSRVEKGTVDNSVQMSNHAEIENFRVKKESWEFTAQSYINAEAKNRTVRDGTDNSIHTIASEVLIGKEETVKLIAKADFKAEVDALSVDEEFVKITSVATYKEECDSYRAECFVSEREEEVESYDNISPSIGLVIGQYFGDCVKSGDLTKLSLQGTYRSEGHADDDKKNDFFSYQDIHKGRYQQDEFDEILESITKKEGQGYEPRERKHASSGEKGVPCFLDDKKWSNSYPSVSVQQVFTAVTSTEESQLLDTEEPHDTSFLKCVEINEKNSDVSLRNIEIFSDFISLESEKKKVFCSELHFRDMGNPSGFVSLKSNKKKKEGLIHLKEGVQLQSCRRQLLSSSVKAFFETGDTCLHQVKDASEIEQQILSDMGVEVQKEKYMAEIDEITPRDIDLKEKKKHHLRQIVWLPRNWLPLPRLGRNEIVGFVEEQTNNGHSGSTLPPAEHEELREMLRLLASDNVPGPKITMKYEMLRLCTMKTFPGRDRPFAIRIVGAGFYYAGHKDQVICYCCGSRKEGWVLGDIPLLIHQNMAPDCGFLTHNALVNVPIRKADCTESPSPTEVRLLAIQESDGSSQSDTAQGESSLMLPSSEQTRIIISNMSHQMLVTNKSTPPNQLISSGRQNVLNTVQTVSADTYSMEEPPPKYPQYAVKNTRINSFQGWPAELRQRPEEMAECGFYYAGFSDCVRCFHCGVGLRHWMSEDDPWIEHARWSTECIYVLRMKGEEFVSLVKMAVEIAEREEAARSNGGKNQASQDSNETAPTAVIQEAPNSGITSSIASKDLPGRVQDTDGNVDRGASSTLPPGNSEIQKYLLTDAAQSVLDMGYQPKLVLRAIERVLMKKGSEELTGQIIMEAVFEIDEEDKLQCKTQPVCFESAEGDKSGEKGHVASGNTQTEESQIDPEKIMREHRELREVTLCKVCLENTSCVVFLPCGHLVTCPDCAPAMRKCPICRTLIKGTVKTFYG